MELPVERGTVRLARNLLAERVHVAHDARVCHERELGVDLLRVLVAEGAFLGVRDVASGGEHAGEEHGSNSVMRLNHRAGLLRKERCRKYTASWRRLNETALDNTESRVRARPGDSHRDRRPRDGTRPLRRDRGP